MTVVILAALLTAFALYLLVGFYHGRHLATLSDLIPLAAGSNARVKNSSEFSASTVATTLSLATVVLAFFELARELGLWLFWTVITTSAGLWAVRLAAKKIWVKLTAYNHRITLHEFLGHEYQSSRVYLIAAVCTSLGFLGAFAVELTVGSRFLAGLLPAIPEWLIVLALAVVGMLYTWYGGFRAVIVTDRIQMGAIWLLLGGLGFYYATYITEQGGWEAATQRVPYDVLHFTWRPDLYAFLIGIFIINVPAFIADMSVWQRIAGSEKPDTVMKGLWSSVAGSALSWGALVILACLVFLFVAPDASANPLIAFLHFMTASPDALTMIVFFFVILGLYSAMLSTASTQLIAVSHTIYEDIFSFNRKSQIQERIRSGKELRLSRLILLVCALLSIAIVFALSAAGFTIADFVFAIYGAQLGLFPPIIIALYGRPALTRRLSRFSSAAIAMSFIAGWSTAGIGKYMHSDTLIFLAPAASLLISGMMMFSGYMLVYTIRRNQAN